MIFAYTDSKHHNEYFQVTLKRLGYSASKAKEMGDERKMEREKQIDSSRYGKQTESAVDIQ